MKFLCLMYLDRELTPPADAVAQYGALREAMSDAGVFLDSGQLHGAEGTKVVRIAGEDLTITDGLLSQAGTPPSAYYLIECADIDTALGWAARIPAARYGTVEVRPAWSAQTAATPATGVR